MPCKTHEYQISGGEKGVVRIWEGFRREVSLIGVLKDGGDLNRRAGQGAVGESGVHVGRDRSTQVLQTVYWVR